MGTVYEAFDRLAQRRIAYKRLRLDAESQRRRVAALFQREYDTLKQLTHPNIVEAHDFGFDELGPFYTMELLTGDELAKLAPLPVPEACRLLRDVASALAILHARRLVHRDVTLGNVKRTHDGRTKLIDFGALTPFGRPSEIVGTPAFIAPECFDRDELDQRADLFALGALAYALLTKRSYTRARSLIERARALHDPITTPSSLVPNIPRALDELVLALLHTDPRARPQSAAEVIARLTILANLPPEDDEQRVAHSYLQRAPLRGRAGAISELHNALSESLRGHGRVVWLESEQGLGRSALLDHAAVEAQLAAATVLRVQGGGHTGMFGTVRVLVENALGVLPDAARAIDHSSLTPVEPGRAVMRSAIDASERRQVIGAGLTAALLEVSRAGPLVLLVDDAHEVDAESLSLVASLLDTLPSRSALLVLASPAGKPAQDPLAEQKLRQHANLLTLSALDEPQICELVGTMFGGVPNSESFAKWLYRQAGGNPGHCIELARLLLLEGSIRYAGGTFTLPLNPRAPPANQVQKAALLATVSGVTPAAHSLVRLLGQHAGALSVQQLARASALSPPAVVSALEELAQRGAVYSAGPGFACASERLRQALRESASSEEIRTTHLALASMFGEEDQTDLDYRMATAHHLLQCGGQHALKGARLLATDGGEFTVDLAARGAAAVPLLESALAVLEAEDFADVECVGVLVPLSLNGFFGQLDVQRRYLRRTMKTLAVICGTARAERLRRWFGAKLALALGIGTALAVHGLTRRAVNHGSFSIHIAGFCALPGAAAAAYASAWDARECRSVAKWLDPFAAASPNSAPAHVRQLCVATAEIASGQINAALERYTRVMEALDKPVRTLPTHIRKQLHAGAMLGRAQALATDTAPAALEVAADLEHRSGYFAIHAETVRAIYHAYRGEMAQAEFHRERAEALALRGGTPAPPLTLLAVRWVLACVMAADVVRLVRALADLQRFARLSPSFLALCELGQAHLDQLRGQPELALPVYDRVLASETARTMPTYHIERALHAQALSAIGQHAAAKALCLGLRHEMNASGRDSDIGFVAVHQQLALAQGALGEVAPAAQLVDSCFERAARHGNPLWLGIMHRTRAQLAAHMRDVASFREHFAAFEALFRATANPCLIQQCDTLRMHAARLGILERHAAIVPENTNASSTLELTDSSAQTTQFQGRSD